MKLTKKSRRLLNKLPSFPALSVFDRDNAKYKQSLGCKKFKNPLCNGCRDFELTSKKCTRFDTMNAYSYIKKYEFKYMFEAGDY